MAIVPQRYNLPVVSADNVYDVLRDLGIGRWPLKEAVPIGEYLKRNLSEEAKRDLRFVPPMTAAIYEAPDGKPATYFQIAPGKMGRKYSITFALVPSDLGPLVPLTASFRPGPERVILQLPSGGFEKGEDYKDGAIREFEEETRIKLVDAAYLRASAVPVHVGATGDLIFPFLGFTADPPALSDRKLDEREFIGTVLFPLSEWKRLLIDESCGGLTPGDTEADGPDMVTIGTTLLALRRLRI